MRTLVFSAALAFCATGALADEEGMRIATELEPVPCGGENYIADAELGTNDAGKAALRVVCKRGAPGAVPEGTTNFVPLLGGLGPALGLGAAAAAVAAAGGGGGSTTSTTSTTSTH